nr:hypothetical protein [Tanacetum cinerariifolium]
MVRPVSKDEIKGVVFSMNDDKAPRPDGFSSKFFKSAWSIIGNEISDNVLLTQELMRNYHRNRGPAKVAFKIDIHMAYDSVEWGFIEQCLVQFGFHHYMVSWIMSCLSSPSFSVKVNGECHGFFKGMRGLRQGDPLSPYLFTLVMEVFSLMVKRRIEEDGTFKYHWRCERLKHTHLSFTDDLMVFAKADVHSVLILSKALKEFSGVSGLVPNLLKSSVFFGNVHESLKSKILHVLPFVVGCLPVRYLGLPLCSSRLSKAHCSSLIDKVKSRLFNWKNKSLSFAGRLQLIKSVVNSMQVYWASSFILPKAVNAEIEQLMRGFLWSHGELRRGHAKVKWRDVSMYRLIDRCSKGRKFWDVPVFNDSCWGWRKLLLCRDVLRMHFVHRIGDGSQTSVWFDNWLSLGPLSLFISKRDIYEAGLSLDCKVCDIVERGDWKWPEKWRNKFPVLFLLPPPIIFHDRKDRVLWKSNNGKIGDFSVSNVWADLVEEKPMVAWHKLVWFSQNIPRHAFMLWLAVNHRLKTLDRINVWQKNVVNKCSLCEVGSESHNHLFFECSYSLEVWQQFKDVVKLEFAPNRLRLMSLKIKKSVQVMEAARLWDFGVEEFLGQLLCDVFGRLRYGHRREERRYFQDFRDC